MTDKHQEEARKMILECLDWDLIPDSYAPLVNRIADLVSARDREIREVLEGLQSKANCWCPADAKKRDPDFHSPACLAARALWNRLQT